MESDLGAVDWNEFVQKKPIANVTGSPFNFAMGGNMGKLLALLTAIVVGSAFADVKIESFKDKTVYRFKVEGLQQRKTEIEGTAFIDVKLLGVEGYEGISADIGSARVPSVRFAVLGDGEIRVEASSEGEVIPLANAKLTLPPVLPPLPRVPGAKRELNWNGFGRLGVSPGRFEVTEVGRVRGQLWRIVSLYPLDYSPDVAKLTLYRDFRVTHHGSAKPEPPGEAIAYVVGAPFKESAALSHYIHYQFSKGYDVHTIDVVAGSSAAQVREKLRKLYSGLDGTLKYVVLVGDQEHVPGMPGALVDGVTDHYYRCLDTEDYQADLGTPDVSVGRFSVRNEADLAAVVAKNERYARGNFKDDSWLERASLIASDDPSWYTVAEGTMNYLYETFIRPLGYAGDKLYAISGSATTADLLASFREGRGYITYGGHGNTEAWLGPAMSLADVAGVGHAEATPFVTSHACYTGHFVEDSFAEAWQRNPKGSVAFWGAMDLDYWGDGDLLQRFIYEAAFGNARNFGEINDRAMRKFWTQFKGEGNSRYFWELYHTFGDPSLRFLKLRK